MFGDFRSLSPFVPAGGMMPATSSDDTYGDNVEALRARRQGVLERLAAVRDDLGRRLDRGSGERSVELENADVLDEIARIAEVELGDIEDRLAEVRTSEEA